MSYVHSTAYTALLGLGVCLSLPAQRSNPSSLDRCSQVAPHRCHHTEPAAASGPSQMTEAGLQFKVGHTYSLVTSMTTHRRSEVISLGRSSNDRAAPLTQPLLRAFLSAVIPYCFPATAGC